MGNPPTPLEMAHGLLDLMLLWIAWSNYTCLGNQARIDTGVFRAGALTAMAAIFVIALVIPAACRPVSATYARAKVSGPSSVVASSRHGVYLAGRALLLLSATGYRRLEQFVCVGVALLLIPVARTLPALAALGLLAALLVVLVGYERIARIEQAIAS